MIAKGNVTIDLEKVPRVEMRVICRAINNAMELFFEDPANQAEFEAWHKAYRAGKEGLGENLCAPSDYDCCDRHFADGLGSRSVCVAG